MMNLANKITIFRILLIPFFVEMILKYNQTPLGQGEHFRFVAIAIFFAAIFTDAVDGFVARQYNQMTELGRALDPIADKLLLLSAIIILSCKGHLAKLPLWFAITVISRDVIIVLGSLLIQFLNGRVRIAPNFLGKATTVAQMTTVLWILLSLPHPEIAWRIAGFFTVVSGLAYIATGSRQFNGSAIRPDAV